MSTKQLPTKMPVRQPQTEDEMRALFKSLGFTEAKIEAAVAMRRKNPIAEVRAKYAERRRAGSKAARDA